MLYGLVGWSVFPETDGVVGKDGNRWQVVKCCKSNRWLHVVQEAEERCCVATNASVVGHTVGNGTHSVLTNTVVNISTRSSLAVERVISSEGSFGGA